MVAMLEEFPGVRVTFNLVPSLVVQVQAFAEDRAQDRHLEIGLKPAADLTRRRGALAGGQRLSRAVRPDDRPVSALRGAARASDGSAEPFAADDLRDLQVWHKLAWIDPDLLARDARLVALVAKGRGFTEDDKRAACAASSSSCCAGGAGVPRRRAPAARSSCRLAVLPPDPAAAVRHGRPPACASRRAAAARRGSAPGRCAAADRAGDRVSRGDVRQPPGGHVAVGGLGVGRSGRADRRGRALRGWRPTRTSCRVRSSGCRSATGRTCCIGRIASASAGPVALFRDHALSDLIGFHYQSWDAGAAADDFVERVRAAGRRFTDDRRRGSRAPCP